MQKQVETILKALRDIEEPEHFIRFLRSRLDWDAEKITAEYKQQVEDRRTARELARERIQSAIFGMPREEILAMIAGTETNSITGTAREK